MSAQITHRRDPDTGHMIQIVSPAELRRVLRADGDSLAPPRDFGPDDEWDVDSDEGDGEAMAQCDDCGAAIGSFHACQGRPGSADEPQS